MPKNRRMIIALFLLLSQAVFVQAAEENNPDPQEVSGTIVDGFRVLYVPNTRDDLSLTVYRGDYIKLKFDETVQDTTFEVPALEIKSKLPLNFKEAPYFKMKTTGTFSFSLGEARGTLVVIGYRQVNYRELTSPEAARIIQDRQPMILDVRTPEEYRHGHLKGAVLIPVQELQARLKELSDYRDREILLYCATGNRSTVASKILIDSGFKHILNMRHGFVDWYRKGHPVER